MLTVGLYWRTLRHLTLRQLVYQVRHRLRGRPRLTGRTGEYPLSSCPATFTFLNQSVTFFESINWNHALNGRLWTYHLNYFDYLNDPDQMNSEKGLALIRDFIRQSDTLRDGLEPYPSSLRIQNWIRFLRRNAIQDSVIDAHLFDQTQLLRGRLEYHLAGNHLLENGFALLTASLYFKHQRWFCQAARLVRTELTKQILSDGAHEERSPAYHQALLSRLNSLLEMLYADTWRKDAELAEFISAKIASMKNWLAAITFGNGDLPRVNDCISVVNNAMVSQCKAHRLTDSGYRMFRRPRYELLADVGAVGPDHQPGHGHADTFSFVVYADGKPLLVDVGTSTYEPGERRQWERSTGAHNTVEVAGQNSSEVWASFRVGQRARVTLLTDTETTLTARHDGYQHLGLIHERSWTLEPAQFHITDCILYQRQPRRFQAIARFYIHPDVPVRSYDNGVTIGSAQLLFASRKAITINITNYCLAEGFNQLRLGQCIEVSFAADLRTTILFTHLNR